MKPEQPLYSDSHASVIFIFAFYTVLYSPVHALKEHLLFNLLLRN